MPNLLALNQLSYELFEMYVTEDLDYVIHEPHNQVKMVHEEFTYAFKGNSIYIKLIDKVQMDVVSFVRLDTEIYFNVEYKVIKLSFSKFNKKGYVRYIFSILLFDFNFYLMSDSYNTIPGSMNFWKKIKQLDNSQCRLLEISTNESEKYNEQEDYHIWGLNEEYFINGELNTLIVEDFWRKKIINSDLYNYIINNQDRISDKESLRLIIQVPNGGV